MKKIVRIIPFICFSMLIGKVSRAQEKEAVVDKIINFPSTFFRRCKYIFRFVWSIGLPGWNTNFMKQNSELASLFRLPDNYGTPKSLAGLQTRAQVQQQIQSQIASGGPNAQQMVQQNCRLRNHS